MQWSTPKVVRSSLACRRARTTTAPKRWRCSTASLKARSCWLIGPMTPMLFERLLTNEKPGATSRQRAIEKAASRSVDGSIANETWSSVSSTSSNSSEESQHATTEKPKTSSQPSNSSVSGCGSKLMSLRLSLQRSGDRGCWRQSVRHFPEQFGFQDKEESRLGDVALV